MQLAGSRIWVTGASSGIGAALANELVRRGAQVAVSARRGDALRRIAGDRMHVRPVDVTNAAEMEAAARTVARALGGVDMAVFNAGSWEPVRVRRLEFDVAAFRHTFDVNVMGLVNGVAAVLPHMAEQGRGAIVGVSSLAGYRGLPNAAAYGASKAAVINLLESLRVDLAPRGIDVQTVCPGFVRTELTARNSFPTPWLVEPEAAARAIADGLAKGKQEIVFPRPMMLTMKAARLIPVRPWTSAFSRYGRR